MTVTSSSSNQTASGYQGIIDAFNLIRIQNGELRRNYDASYQGIIRAVLDLKKWGNATSGEFPPGWEIQTDGDGNITGGAWNPTPENGTLWFDQRVGRLFVWEDDGFYQANGADGVPAVSDNPPTQQVTGQLWYNTTTGALYIYNGSTWTQISDVAGVDTSTLVLSNPTQSSFTGFSDTITAPTVVTQEDYNQWLVTALQTLETNLEATISAEPMQYGTMMPSTGDDGTFFLKTDENELYVRYSNNWLPVSPAQDISTDSAIAALQNANTTTSSSISSIENDIAALQLAVSGNDTDITALQAQPHHTYTIGTASTTGNSNTGIYIVDETNASTGVAISGAGNVEVADDANGITINISAAEQRISEIEADYLTSADKTSLESDITAIETTISDYATVLSNISALQTDVAALPTFSDLSVNLDAEGAQLFGAINVQDNRITNVAVPTNSSDAATRGYVDGRETVIRNDLVSKTGGSVSHILITNSNADIAGIDYSGAANMGLDALKFQTYSLTGTNYATFGTTTTPWEYSWEYESDESFNWIRNGTRVFAINGEKTYAKDLVLCDLAANANGPQFNNQIDVRTKLAQIDTLQASITALQVDTHDPHVFYGDTAPTEATLTDGDIWFDSYNLRLNVRHSGYWIFPDRVEDVNLKSALHNAVDTSSDYATLKTNLLAALS
ncbi:MAG: hypothetical protein CBD74_12650 [Saprospirales bacterium TMED214]|nr:MAG: hypothetical protein CBD74_12650 [Saprospirales bacterium TMED214]